MFRDCAFTAYPRLRKWGQEPASDLMINAKAQLTEPHADASSAFVTFSSVTSGYSSFASTNASARKLKSGRTTNRRGQLFVQLGEGRAQDVLADLSQSVAGKIVDQQHALGLFEPG